MSIVVGFTPTPAGEAALQAATALATERDTDLIVVNSSRGDAWSDPGFARLVDIERIGATLKQAGVRYALRREVRGREACEEVLAVLAETGAELCVIGIRRRSAAGKMILGSNAFRILMEAPCPVLSVKALSDKAGA